MLSRAAALATVAQRFAERVAVTDRAGSITYATLFRYAAGLAHRLIDAGVRPGEPVASVVRNSIPAVWAGYGIALSGAADLALNPNLNEADRRHCLTLGQVRHVVTTAAEAPFFEALGLSVHRVEHAAERPLVPEELPPTSMDDWARVGFTSGTTGLPKGIVTSQRGRWMGNLLQRATMPHRPGPHSRLLLMTPFSHGASLLTFAYMDVGGSVILLDGVDTDYVLGLLRSRAVDEMFAPPTVLAKIVAAAEDTKLPGLKTIYCGTAVLSPRLYARARSIFGPVIRITYGKTEVVNPITALEAPETDAWYAEGGEHADACVGWPASGVEISIDPEIGEIRIRAQQMMAGTIRPTGYEPLPPGAFHETGDLGYVDERGRLHLTGRAADVIKSGGYKVAPEEIERVLSAALGQGEVAVFGIDSEYWGQVIVAVAESPAPGWQATIRPAIDGMTAYKRPRALLAMPELPRNAMLKISRKAVREHVLAGHRLIDGPRPVLEKR
ncbi:MAG: class I adenylate-forming enzyme family protein [Acetobacteraceae bacterium]|nr:class I adenylate-forming enzyme family protein [Acetobacteraceae bacterium]